MKKEKAIKWVDDRMCWGRGTFTANHLPNIDECWEAGRMAIEALLKDAAIDNTQYEWIVEHDGNGWNDWENLICPKCGKKHEHVPYHYNFCPDCGERMKLGVKDI